MIDSEGARCPVKFANELNQAFTQKFPQACFATVVKHRSIENWLIADPSGIATLRARFLIDDRFRRQVEGGKADSVENAVTLLNRAALGKEYHKSDDPKRIIDVCDPFRACQNSRSLRKFLTEIL